MSFSLSLHFLLVLSLLNSKVLPCFSGVIMSIRLLFLSLLLKFGDRSCEVISAIDRPNGQGECYGQGKFQRCVYHGGECVMQ